MYTKSALSVTIIAFALASSGCDESECRDGTRECDANVSRTCVEGVWREVVCRDAAPICDVKYGCRKSTQARCGNGVIELGEDCDGSAVHGRTCADVNAALAGPLACGAGCRFDTRSCVPNECEEDARQCRGTVLQYCSQNVWKDVQDCADGGLVCDPQAMACAAK